MQRNAGEHEDNKGQDEPTPTLTTTATEQITATATAKRMPRVVLNLDPTGYGTTFTEGRPSRKGKKLQSDATASKASTSIPGSGHIETATKKRVPRWLSSLDPTGYGTTFTEGRPSRKGKKIQSDATASKATRTSATDKTSSARLTKSVKNNEHDGSYKKKNNQSKSVPSKRKLTSKKNKKKESSKKKSNKNGGPIKRIIIPGSGQILGSGSWVHPKNKKSRKVPTINGIEGFVNMLTGRKTLGDLVEARRCENEAILLCQTVDLEAYSFERVRGGPKCLMVVYSWV